MVVLHVTVQVKPARPHNTADPDSSKWAPPSGSDRQTSGQGGDDEEVGSDAAEDFIHAHPWVVTFGRIGWAANRDLWFKPNDGFVKAVVRVPYRE